MVWSLALCPDDAKQYPVVYGTEFGVVFLYGTVVDTFKKHVQTVLHACRKTSRHHSTVSANIRILCKPAAVTTFVLRKGICDTLVRPTANIGVD